MASGDSGTNNRLFGGVKARNLKEISPKFICEFCTLILFFPWQLMCCGALVCKYCLFYGVPDSESFTCPFCQKKQSKREALFDRGADRELRRINVLCHGCDWQGSYENYLIHLNERHADYQCPDCQKYFIAINSLGEHRQELCSERSIPCGLSECSSAVKVYEMSKHYRSTEHQHRLAQCIVQWIYHNNQHVQDQNYAPLYQELSESIELAVAVFDITNNDFVRLVTDIRQGEATHQEHVSKINNQKNVEKENIKKLKEISETDATIQNIIDTTVRIGEEGKFSVLDNNSSVIFRCNFPSTTSFSITLPKFRTSAYGCTFFVRLCSTLIQNQSYLSLFITLCNTDYYNLIPFPFSYDIHVMLCDQTSERKHIKHVLHSDLVSSSCTRPTRDCNEEFGIEQFCLLQCLTDSSNNYVRDGVFFTRIFIDFLGTKHDPF